MIARDCEHIITISRNDNEHTTKEIANNYKSGINGKWRRRTAHSNHQWCYLWCAQIALVISRICSQFFCFRFNLSEDLNFNTRTLFRLISFPFKQRTYSTSMIRQKSRCQLKIFIWINTYAICMLAFHLQSGNIVGRDARKAYIRRIWIFINPFSSTTDELRILCFKNRKLLNATRLVGSYDTRQQK